MNPAALPANRRHLDEAERRELLRLELLVAGGHLEEAQDVAESLWRGAVDAHRDLYKALANALTAACARRRRQTRGARQIAARTREMMAPFPREVLGIQTDALLESLDRLVERGSGPLLLRRQG